MKTDYTHTTPKEISFIVYINGFEVPVSGVSVNAGKGTVPTAHISMVPDPSISRLGVEDMVEVQIFYKDDYYSAREGKSPDFRLLFDGVIVGWEYSSSALGRQITFSCVQVTHVLRTIKSYFITGADAAASVFFQSPTGSQIDFIQPGMTVPWSYFIYGFGVNNKPIRRPYDFISNIFKACVGKKEAPKLGSVVNSGFISRFMKRHRIPFRFAPSPLLETDVMREENPVEGAFPVLRYVRSQNILDSVLRQAQSFGNRQDLWSATMFLFQNFFYEVSPIIAPPAVQMEMSPESENHGLLLGPPEWNRQLEITQLEYPPEALVCQDVPEDLFLPQCKNYEMPKPLVRHRPTILLDFLTKPPWWFGVPPTCNIIFPSMIKSLTFSENYQQQPTRLYVNDVSLAAMTNQKDEMGTAVGTMKTGFPPMVDHELEKQKGEIGKTGNPYISGKNLLVWPEEYFRGPNSVDIVSPKWMFMVKEVLDKNQTVEQQLAQQALDILNRREDQEWYQAYDTAVKETEGKTTAQLAELLKSNPSGLTSDEIKQTYIEERGKQLVEDALNSSFTEQERATIELLKQQGVLPENYKNRASIISYLQTLADEHKNSQKRLNRVFARYEFFRLKGNARRLRISMPFNPYLAVGFPAIVFEESHEAQHFVGYVVEVTHQLSTHNAETVVELINVQTFDEFVNEVFNARIGNNYEGFSADVLSAPIHFIKEIRDVVQNLEKAEEYFSRVFYRGTDFSKAKIQRAAFDFTKAVNFLVPGKRKLFRYTFDDLMDDNAIALKRKIDSYAEADEKEAEELANKKLEELKKSNAKELFDVEKFKEEYVAAKRMKRQLTPPRNLSNKVLDNYIGIAPTKQFSLIFKDFALAMQYISRPVCTLDEYAKFRGEYARPAKTIPADDPVQGKGAKYVEYLLNLKAGPGDPPELDENNFIIKPAPKDLPDTRRDWLENLKVYKSRILFGKKIPFEE